MNGVVARWTGVTLGVLLLPTLVLAQQGDPAKGKELYAKHCAGCHGPTGSGDGPAAAAINPRPTDLSNKGYMAGLKDQYLFDLVQKGGAAMGRSPLIMPFGKKLKDAEIRDVIAYVRRLGSK